MRLKSYFSATVEAAMEQARRELGEDALLVNARPTRPESRYLGAYEVVFGVVPTTEPTPPAAEAARASDPQLRDDLADMRRQIERLMLAFPSAGDQPLRPTVPTGAAVAPPGVTALLAEELSAELADAVSSGRALGDLYTTDPHLGTRNSTHATVALVGPPGVGKTATLIKLAVLYGLAVRRPVHILSADVFRIAAADQLRALAAILGIGCDLAETPMALAQKLDEPGTAKGLTLIDTPGFSPRELDDASELVQVLSSRTDVDTHLVLSASMKPADLSRVASSYKRFRPTKLLFTRLDETAHYGSLVNLSAGCQLPISFLCAGQQIPDDLEEASRKRIDELILGDNVLAARTERRLGVAA